MSLAPKPCAHCNNATFIFIPNMRVDIGYATTVLGMNATQKIPRVDWTFTLVACTNCGFTQTFTSNAPAIAERIPGSSISTVAPR